MNIFVLDESISKSAQYHVDKHVVKMPIELAQLMATCHRMLRDVPSDSSMYKSTHHNHPCARWVRMSADNYNYTYELFLALNWEYSHRYGNTHGVISQARMLRDPPKTLDSIGLTEHPQCVPDEFKVKGDTVASYRNYYLGSKRKLFSWKKRPTPEWIT